MNSGFFVAFSSGKCIGFVKVSLAQYSVRHIPEVPEGR